MGNYEQIYIQDFIITYLEKLVNDEMPYNDMPWMDMNRSVEVCRKGGLIFMNTLHDMMLPYYEMYFTADPSLCRNDAPAIHTFMEEVVKVDSKFGVWASNQDLIAATISWGEYMKRKQNDNIGSYFRLLRILFSSKVQKDWNDLSLKLEGRLFNTEVNADYKTGELLCIFHAFVRIMNTDWSDEKKRDNISLLVDNWGFLRYFYSIMIRRIVGSKLPNWAALTNCLKQSNDFHPHAHIFYCALIERMNSLNLNLTQFKKLDNAKDNLRIGVLDKTPPSEILYELCDTIFPEEFQSMLQKHRPKSYDEVCNENDKKDILLQQMQKESQSLKEKMCIITELFEKMVTSSISINDIENELNEFSPGMAWDMLEKLNQNLSWNPVWRQHYPELRKNAKQRLQDLEKQQSDFAENMIKVAEQPANIYNYAAGSKIFDNRKYLNICEKGDNSDNIKQIVNE